ncbi:cytochrome P450 [Marasmius fiardii PR-910]|nr:cytochrome P450 [Marasmius fiardii PR-910]
MDFDLSLLLLVISVLVATVYSASLHRTKNNHFPPGPGTGSWIGNVNIIPSRKPWVTFAEWGKRYGPLVYLKVPGQHFFFINSNKVADELLKKRSRTYSSRGFADVLDDAGWGFLLPAMAYTEEWRVNRRLHHQSLKFQTMPRFYPIMKEKVNLFLRTLIKEPEEFMENTEVLSGGAVLGAMFGLNVTSPHSRALQLSKVAIRSVDKVVSPQFVFVTTYIPFYRFLPTWFPVLGQFKVDLLESLTSLRDMRELVTEHTMKLLKEGDAKSSLVAELMEVNRGNGGSVAEDERIVNMGMISYAAGADTMVSSIWTFFLAMLRYPHCKEKAQTEIDSVIGNDRLPTFADRSSLPYVEAIYRETMRWHPPLPLAPHATIEDDFYDGYYIPKGSVVFGNIWGLTRDQDVFENPDEFIPERYYNNLDDQSYEAAFGFGRRICVGRYFAGSVVWLTIATVLAAFRLEKAKDEQGQEIDTPESYSEGPVLFSRPLPFRCSITPRSERAKALIETFAN